jgi:hypothetical protein
MCRAGYRGWPLGEKNDGEESEGGIKSAANSRTSSVRLLRTTLNGKSSRVIAQCHPSARPEIGHALSAHVDLPVSWITSDLFPDPIGKLQSLICIG